MVLEIADNNLITNGNKALYFNNPTDVLNIDGSTIINDKMTIEAIVLFDSDTDGGGLFVEDWVGQGTPGQKNFNISPARLLGYVFPNDLSNGYFQPDVNLSVKSWHHVAFVLDGNQERFYVDGWLIASRSSNSGNVPDTNTCCMLGYGWKGYISSFRISNNARYSGSSHTPSFSKLTTDANTLLLYNFNEAPGSTTISDESGNNRTGRLGTVGPRSPSPTSPTFVTKEASMVSVQGGTLPSGSGLAGQVVQSFEIGRYEVTWAEWQTVRTYAIANGYDLTGIGNGTASTHPVQNVNWYDVLKWCNAKSQMEGLTPVYTVSGATYKTGQSVPTVNASANGYRLPVEKEWEWAARGGVASKGYSYSGSNDANIVAWHSGNSGSGTKPIGLKLANELGVFDMSGNVFEWCWDEVPGVVGRRIRGGGFFVNSDSCQISLRGNPSPNNRDGYNGFRLARNQQLVLSVSAIGSSQSRLGDAFNYGLNTTGGVGPYTYQIVSGSLPQGLQLTSDGRIIGTSQAAGAFTITMRVTDSLGNTKLIQVTITIDPASSNPSIALGAGIDSGGGLTSIGQLNNWSSIGSPMDTTSVTAGSARVTPGLLRMLLQLQTQ